MPRAIIIVPYDERWPQAFAELARPLREALGDLALRIDHIGSTAVPGLAAKDIIDIQVTVKDFAGPLESALAPLGYTCQRDYTCDHQPPHHPGLASEWEKRYFHPPPDMRPMHLHVRAEGRANQRYALLFRDYLRSHPLAAGAYAQIKRALARSQPHDWNLYYDVKDPVCDVIISAAEDWAQATDWQPGPSDV